MGHVASGATLVIDVSCWCFLTETLSVTLKLVCPSLDSFEDHIPWTILVPRTPPQQQAGIGFENWQS